MQTETQGEVWENSKVDIKPSLFKLSLGNIFSRVYHQIPRTNISGGNRVNASAVTRQ